MPITNKNHRVDFQTCPHCLTEHPYGVWDDTASSFSTGTHFCKHNSGVVTSKCPTCTGLSWVHVELRHFNFHGVFPKRWTKRAEAELDRRQIRALRKWGDGICWKCDRLESGEVNTTAWRHCPIGSGPPEKECSKFKAYTGKISDG